MNMNKVILILGALLVLGIKFSFLFLYGPLVQPDTGGYTGFANLILTSTTWLHEVDIQTPWQLGTNFRSIGYPLVIVVFQTIFGESYDWALASFQILFSLFASYLIYKLAFRLSERFWVGFLSAFAHAMGLGLITDGAILTDSLNTSLLVVITCVISLNILADKAPSYKTMLGLGILMSASFLIREAGDILQILYWPLVIYWLLKFTGLKLRAVALFLVFFLPMFGSSQLYKSWNEYRTGERFITTAGQTTMFFPGLRMMSAGKQPFGSDPYLKDFYLPPEEAFMPAPMEAVRKLNLHLAEKTDMTSVDISRYAFKVYANLWKDHPADMLKTTLGNIREKQAFTFFMPIESMVTLDFWYRDQKLFHKRKDAMKRFKEEGRVDVLLAYIGQALSRFVAVLLALGFLIVLPIKVVPEVLRKRSDFAAYDSKLMVMFMLWLLYLGFTSAYAMVHLEQRYLMPVIPFASMIGFILLSGGVQRIINRLPFKKA